MCAMHATGQLRRRRGGAGDDRAAGAATPSQPKAGSSKQPPLQQQEPAADAAAATPPPPTGWLPRARRWVTQLKGFEILLVVWCGLFCSLLLPDVRERARALAVLIMTLGSVTPPST